MAISNESYARNYQFHFGRIPNLTFQVVTCPLPTISMGQMIHPTSLHDIPMPGEKLTFDPCSLEFVVDENFDSYLEIFNWMQDMRAGSSVNGKTKDMVSDATLDILTNNMTPLISFDFVGMFPTILGELQLTTQNGTDVLLGSATFAYEQFTLRK